ncbi:Oidioi.mRNA.OKI2018_I69.chr1.g1367.t1.cds [Oikopleura dioica]|uniref:Oidioi.mRNA.OKI2018_I69.chr1.g1367.t1.cds n=1 Tax=Oikopleura dioica TaxID=34765 RepID=A0ABN7SN77_OIKDI|nr:Oidioi.mRNA.OKI2018_I69.chr1.g1367.t1.cds [Oikopleura dioica]
MNYSHFSQKRQSQIRNERERQRVRNVNQAFEILRETVPNLSRKRLSKVETLRAATAYIQFLIFELEKHPEK